MPVKIVVGVFAINYTLFTNAPAGFAVQFGMDFTLTSTVKRALTQLIFPATAVGSNVTDVWNIDNHKTAGDASSLIFSGAENGIIHDTPREISARNKGIKRTKFSVYLIDTERNVAQSKGVKFTYSINTDDATPETIFEGLTESTITNEQKKTMIARCAHLKFE